MAMWTEDMKAYVLANYATTRAELIGQALGGLSKNAVIGQANRLGLAVPRAEVGQRVRRCRARQNGVMPAMSPRQIRETAEDFMRWRAEQ